MLDASTLTKENFKVTSPGGQNSMDVTNVQYVPLEKQLKIHISSDDITGAGPYKVTSQGVLDCYGNKADIEENALVKPSMDCGLYDMSIQSVYFAAFGNICILQPQMEEFETIVSIINSSHLTKQKKLIIYGEKTNGNPRVIYECDVILEGYETQEIIHKTVINDNEKVYAVLK